jgi:hypothetical protein
MLEQGDLPHIVAAKVLGLKEPRLAIDFSERDRSIRILLPTRLMQGLI